jgi:hypothetical protein
VGHALNELLVDSATWLQGEAVTVYAITLLVLGLALLRTLAGPLARILVWTALLAAFAFSGLQGLEMRRVDFEGDPLGGSRVASDPFASEDRYLSEFGLSVAGIDQLLADVPVDEPIVFVRHEDPVKFHEFSILSYATWPRRLYSADCSGDGQPRRGPFTPSTESVGVAIADVGAAPATSAGDRVQQIAPTVWLVRTHPGRAWASFCQ